MGFVKFQVQLDQRVFLAGQAVTGVLYVEVDNPKTIRGIYLKYKGVANVMWTEHKSKNETRTYRGEERYFDDTRQFVYGNGQEIEIPPGQYTFPFKYNLPHNLPNSFEGQFGRVRYSVKAVIDRPWKLDCKEQVPFTVLSLLDLNADPVAPIPVKDVISKTFLGHSNSLEMTLMMPTHGYVPGQNIIATVGLTNKTSIHVKKLRLKLKQIVKYQASTKVRWRKNLIACSEVPVHEDSNNTVVLAMKVPPIPPSYLMHCNIIDIAYRLKVEADVKEIFHRNLSIKTSIIIGSVAVMRCEAPNAPPMAEECCECPGEPPAYGFINPGSTQLTCRLPYELPPPTYEEATTESKEHPVYDSEGDEELHTYRPLYPVFQFDKS